MVNKPVQGAVQYLPAGPSSSTTTSRLCEATARSHVRMCEEEEEEEGGPFGSTPPSTRAGKKEMSSPARAPRRRKVSGRCKMGKVPEPVVTAQA